jgi:hypothetical protein
MAVKVLDKKLSLKEYETHLLRRGIISKVQKEQEKYQKN